MCTSCECEACGSTLHIVVTSHSDPNANGLRMSKVDFCSPDGSCSWSEIWYLVMDKAYSLRGCVGQRLEESPTSIVFEAPLRSAFAGAQSCTADLWTMNSCSHAPLLVSSPPGSAGLTRY